MTSRARLYRLEFAVAALGLTAALGALIIALDAIRFHTTQLLGAVAELRLGDLEPTGIVLLVIAGLDAAVIATALRALLRQVHKQRRFVSGLRMLGAREIDGQRITVVDDARPLAFCGGFFRPRIFVSVAALDVLDSPALRAVVAHEASHAARRDPLRLLVARSLSSAFAVIPPLRALGERQAALAELAADAAAVRALGDARPLAAAWLTFDSLDSDARAGVAPERVDHLLGRGGRADVPRALVLVLAVALGALAALTLRLAVLPGHPEMPPAAAPLCTLLAICTLLVLGGPAWLACRRVRSALQPR